MNYQDLRAERLSPNKVFNNGTKDANLLTTATQKRNSNSAKLAERKRKNQNLMSERK